jgi:hypothetical protein
MPNRVPHVLDVPIQRSRRRVRPTVESSRQLQHHLFAPPPYEAGLWQLLSRAPGVIAIGGLAAHVHTGRPLGDDVDFVYDDGHIPGIVDAMRALDAHFVPLCRVDGYFREAPGTSLRTPDSSQFRAGRDAQTPFLRFRQGRSEGSPTWEFFRRGGDHPHLFDLDDLAKDAVGVGLVGAQFDFRGLFLPVASRRACISMALSAGEFGPEQNHEKVSRRMAELGSPGALNGLAPGDVLPRELIVSL